MRCTISISAGSFRSILRQPNEFEINPWPWQCSCFIEGIDRLTSIGTKLRFLYKVGSEIAVILGLGFGIFRVVDVGPRICNLARSGSRRHS